MTDAKIDWVLVPREPTGEMIRAAMHTDLSYMPGHQGPDRAAVYRAMLAAAPTPPPIGDGEGDLVARLRRGVAKDPKLEVVWVQNMRAFLKEEMFRTFPEWRSIFVSEFETMLAASAEAATAIEALRAERDVLLSGERAVLPQTKEHAENLYTVAVACLKSFGVDPESQVSTLSRQLEEAMRALNGAVCIYYENSPEHIEWRDLVARLRREVSPVRRAKESVSHV